MGPPLVLGHLGNDQKLKPEVASDGHCLKGNFVGVGERIRQEKK